MANRILILIIGLLIGIIIGGGVFWYLSGSTGKNIFIVNQQLEKKGLTDDLNTPEAQKSKLSKVNPKTGKAESEEDFIAEADTLANESELLNEAGKNKIFEKDSLLLALSVDSVYQVKFEEENIIVKKDELLASKSITLWNLDQKQTEETIKKDSLLSAMSGIKESSNLNAYTLEFWKSPINYRGYKMGRNKLVLFGIQSADAPQIFKLNENLYLKNGDKVYKIDKITDFRPYELINDPNILNQLH